MSEIKYLDLAGLAEFKEELDKVRLSDNLNITEALNDISSSIGNGTLTIKKNNVSQGTFTANLKTNTDINISVPTNITDLGQTAITEIQNLIRYGQLDVSSLTNELKLALHESIASTYDYLSEADVEDKLEAYGKIIHYDSSTLKIQLKNGDTVLSEFSAADFISDGMVEDVRITSGTGDNVGKTVLLFDFNTASGITDIEIPLEDIFDASNYYTKTEVNNLLPNTLTQSEVNTGTDTTGKLVSAKIIRDSIDNAIYGGGGSSGTVITTINLSAEGISAGFAKTVQVGTNTPIGIDSNGNIPIPAYPTTLPASDVSSWAKQSTKPSYNLDEVIDGTTRKIPTKVSDLTNDAGFTTNEGTVTGIKVGTAEAINPVNGVVTIPAYPITLPASDVSSWAKESTKPTYTLDEVADGSNRSIPTKVSDLTNDSGYLVSNDISGKADKSEMSITPGTGTDADKTTILLKSGTSTTVLTQHQTIPSSLPASDVYDWAKAATKPSYNYNEIGNTPTLGTAAAKDVPTSGNASTTQVVMGDDTRLTDSRQASDVYSWAKAENKPTYTKSEVGLSDVTNDAQVKRSEMGVANGVATLGSDGKVPSSQLPSYVDDVVEGYLYNGAFYEESTHETTITGESSKIYVDLTTDKSYRWGGSAYTEISSSDVTGIKIGASGSTISPSNGVITLPEYPEQLQSDWEQSTTTAKDYIKNKPTIITNQAILDLFGGSSVDPSENANIITTNDVVSTTKNGIVPKTTAAIKYLQTDAQGVASWGDLPADNNTTYKLTINGTDTGDGTTSLGSVYTPTTAGTTGQYLKSMGSGAPAWENFPASLPASDVQSWAKAANKPSYGYGEIAYLSATSSDYTIANSSTTLSVDGTQPLQVVTTTANIAGITFSALPADGHSCHLIITAASALTVDIAHNATMITVESTAYTTVCPKAAAIDTLEITAGGYVELDLLRVGTKIYVRGV